MGCLEIKVKRLDALTATVSKVCGVAKWQEVDVLSPFILGGKLLTINNALVGASTKTKKLIR